MRVSIRVGQALACLVCLVGLGLGCHNQSTEDDTGQAMHGKEPDKLAVPPEPVVATPAGPVSSVPAVLLGATVPNWLEAVH